MADSNCKGDASASSSPQLIFIRLRKDKSKDEIEDEIFKFATKVWQESCEKGNTSAKDKNCITLPDLDSRTIRQVAVGPEYVGVLLADGRVCRFKCVSQNICASSKPPNSQTSVDGLPFHVSSDEVASSTISVTSPICVGSTTSSAPVASPFASATVKSRTVQMNSLKTFPSTSNLGEYPKTGEVKPIDMGNSSSYAKQSEIPTKEGQTNSENVSFTSQPSVSVSKSSSSVGNSCVGGPSCSNSTRDTDGNGKSVGKKTKIAKAALQDSDNQIQEVSLGRSYGQVPNGNNVVESSTTAPQSHALNNRRSVSSPTLLQRTVFARNVPGISYFVPAVSCVSFPAYLTTCPTIPARLQPHIVRAQLATAGAFPRGPVTAAVQRRDDQNGDSKPLSCNDDNFCYPEAGFLEWLEVEAGTEVAFSHITAMHSDFLLVEKGTGILYHWPYESDFEYDLSMEMSSACANLRRVPVAKPHPLGEMLGLDYEQVHIIASCNVRCSLVTSSGKICTFYDKLLRESNCGEPPALIQELSHSATMFADLKGEKIQSVSCSEFFTSVLTQSGKIFWWGLLPTEERQTFRQKLNKATNEASNIAVDEKVQLRQHFPGFPGALVYRSCDVRGPLVGCLIGHESPEGNSTTVTKIRVELLNPVVSTNVKLPSTVVQMMPESTVPAVVNSPRSQIEEELRENHRDATRSFSPHTSVRSKAQSSNKSGSGSEIWEVKDVVFLESENKPLGTVVTIDGQHVIVKVANTLSPAESSLRVFKISELEPVPTISEGLEGAALNQQLPTSSLYRGCIQHIPKCIVGKTKSGNKELLAGLKPVAMTTTSFGISVLAQRSLDGKSFFLGPATEQASDSSKVYTCSSDVNISNSNDDGSCTVEAEATPSQDAALGPICAAYVSCNSQQKSFAGQKRKTCADDEDDGGTQPVSPDLDYATSESLSSGGPVPCNFHSSSSKYPLLHSASGFDIVLLTDANGCLYPRPYGIKLSSPSVGQLAPVQSLALGTRLTVGSAEGNSSAERMLMVFIGFQEQPLLQAVQSGVVFKIKEALSWLEQLNNSKDVGKGTKGAIKGSKKIAISNNQGEIKEEMVEQFVPAISEMVSQILHQRLSSNQNVLHVCCSCPAFAMEEQGDNDCLGQDYFTAVHSSNWSTNPTEELPVEVAGLEMLLKHSLFAPEMVPMLKERDAHGYTPFMTSIVCRNFKAAMYILKFVESNKENGSPRLRCSLKDMIFPEAFNGVTPLHALSIACTENLPPSGLGNSLTVTNLPSSYTPRILLKLFQGRYPSAYRATIPPTAMDGRKYCCGKSRRQKILEKCSKGNDRQLLKKPVPKRLGLLTPTTSTGPSWNRRYGDGGSRIPIVGRRESLTGMVTFADPRELRQALVEMDHHMVSSEMTSPEGGLASLVQHVLHVKLSELENDEAEKVEMEVGVRGGVYDVSSAEGQANIVPKAQTSVVASAKMERREDELICQLFQRLLSYPEIATGRNKEDETTLAFLVNNSRWIKYASHQNTSLRTYGHHLFEQVMASTDQRETVPQSLQDNEVMAEIKLTRTADASMLESNLLAQLDDISSSFQNIVDTLTTLEKRCSVQQQQPPQQQPIPDENFKVRGDQLPPVSGCTVTPTAAFSKASMSTYMTDVPNEPSEGSNEKMPVLIQLTQSWSSVAATILGFYPTDTELKHTDELMSEYSSGLTMMESSTLDSFVHELLLHVDEAVVVSFVETIVTEMNKYSTCLTLDMVLGSNLLKNVTSPRDVSFSVGLKFLRSVIRQLAVHLSRSGLSYVDLQSRIGSGSMLNSARHNQSDSANFMKKVKMILKSFSWLSVHELIQAAEASVLPVREGVAKPQARSTGSSVSNGVPNPNVGFRGVRWSSVNPGIRVSGPHDTSGRPTDPLLRTAYRLNENRPTTTKSSCRGVRLANITEGSTSSPTIKKPSPGPQRSSRFELSRALGKKSALLDSDSDTDDDMDQIGSMLSEADSDMEIDEADQQSVAMTTGITHDHPYAWALDGRVMNINEAYNAPGNVYISVVHLATDGISPRSVHTGNCYLTRMFSRMVKETLDLMTSLSQDTSSAGARRANDAITPVLTIGMDESRNIQNSVMLILEKSWVWLAGVLDVVEGQLRMGKYFDTKRYLATLQRPEEADLTVLTRSMATVSGATPEEYLMFLLRAHHNEHKDALPVLDMLCYEHTVYVLDAFIYSMTHWPCAERILTRSISSVSSLDGEVFGSSFSQTPQPEAGPSSLESRLPTNTESKRRHRQNHERKLLEKFFGMDVMQADKDKFLNSLHDTVQQKFPKVPKASWEVFTHNVTVTRQKSVNETILASQRESEVDSGLPTTFSGMAKQTYTSPLVLKWSPNQALDRWKISVDLFSRLFLADGPGAERDSFLAARAGVAGRLARFRRTTSYLRDSVTSDSHQVASHHHHYHGYGGLGGRLGTTLSLSIKRQRILEDTFRILGEMSSFHYSNLRIKFEGEDGSGPGVNRGFFAAVANALKSDEKLPPETTALLHEPGKLPEQCGFYAPKPFAYLENSQDDYLKTRRQKMFTAIGRFMGLSLWFNNTVPLNFSRHVVMFLLEREVTWEDLAFFNADLFEGLSRMIIDGTNPLMTPESFQATYCCHFETSVGGSTEELFPGGSQIPVTPDNIYSYVRLYATKVMIGCVESELRAMRSGLHDIIPSELLSSLTAEDFQLLLSGGTTDVDINRLRLVITFINSNGCSADILEKFKRWFWSIVQKMTPLQRQQLLYFCTGSAVLPAVTDRRDPDQDLNITIDVVGGNTKMLPMATTCGQRMSIPLYSSKKILKRKLLQAIQCQSYGLG